MTDVEYEERTDSVRNFMKLNKMGKYKEKTEEVIEEREEQIDHKALSMKIGDRCMVEIVDGGMKKLGTVQFIG